MLPIGNQSSNVAKQKNQKESINETQWKCTPRIDKTLREKMVNLKCFLHVGFPTGHWES